MHQSGPARERLLVHLAEAVFQGLALGIEQHAEGQGIAVVAQRLGQSHAGIARQRLIDVFDLSEAQAGYILDLQLRRLTKFSRLELETEQSELQRTIEELEAILHLPVDIVRYRERMNPLLKARIDREGKYVG